jgi:type VI secretion system protein ImpH
MANRDLSVAEQLLTEGYRFDFFQAVRLLNQMADKQDPIGYASLPQRESVRFHSFPSMSFPPSAIYDITRSEDREEPMNMVVAFMGLTGPQGVMPQYYTELIMERLRYQDRTLLDFFDLFTHRLISLFYRSWEKYQVTISFEGAKTHEKKPDRIFQHILRDVSFDSGYHGYN